ncbi:PHP-associated domain-containing protein [uncultured Methanoregula sp.]|uniref:endonuclease Q family protein n=1 Tax=uncultured Methanoregula sp. TaxID=1005933 RepID=UPI002AAB50E5|nr:PHP-associated domain-containing protein [uncultured Methanoregula sp.]
MHATADLHIHSPYSIAVSRFMQPIELLRGCGTKGIRIIGTGDALQPDWMKGWEPYVENDFKVIIVPQGEIEDKNRVHHVILAEDPAQFSQLRDLLEGTCKSFITSGRPHVYLSGEEIAHAAHDAGALIGPAHAFTPWTAMYAYFDSVPACYGDAKIDFVELGLSADSSYGAAIPDLYDIPFLTNSDAHSPYPDKLGREFNRIRLEKPTAKGVIAAIRKGAIEMNAGFFPEEGKYNRTACTRCYTQYSLKEAKQHQWRCPADGGIIKKGVSDRAKELSEGGTARSRPPYAHVLPLAQIIQTMEGASSPNTKKCRAIYSSFIETFGNEIAVLIDIPVTEIRSVHPKVADAIAALRDGTVTLHPGGGGKYGTFSLG